MSRTDDVIELGSSDEESQPPAKKHKPTPNAMVHIPHRLPGITIRPAKSTSSKMDIPSKRIPVKKTVNRVPNPLAMGVKVNDRPLLNKTLQMVPDVPAAQCNFKPNSVKLLKKVNAPIQVLPGTIKPIQKISMPIQGLPGSIKPIKKVSIPNRSLPGSVKAFPIKIKHPNNSDGHPGGKPIVLSGFKQNSVHLREPINLKKNMSSSMIVKRMKLNQNISPAKIKEQLLNKPGDVLTVEIEDDDTNVLDKGYTGPQWYMPPEDENVNNDLEMENNSEPQCSQLVEITIEDSPVKPPHKQTCEIGKEYAVTIEDSPVQLAHKGNSSESEDDNNVQENKKDYHSKKKLHYPITSSPKQTLEVEFEPIAAPPLPENKAIKTCVLASETIEIEESPVKINPIKETTEVDTPKKVPVQNPTIQPVTMKSLTETKTDTSKSMPVEIEDVETSQFHPTYQSFIDLCFKLENSDDMKKIVEKKIKGYYSQVPKEYTESEEFLDMVSGKIISMKSSPEKMYLYIKDVVDELNLQRKMAKTKVELKDEKKIEAEKFLYGKESQFDAKRQKQIRKLEKTLKKLHRAIQKLEEQEVDFDDDEDSVYLLTERYKERMVKVHAKFCQLTKTKMPSEPRVYIDARPGQPQGPAKRLEKWINRKVPLGTPLPFPDFHDVLHCVKEANEQDALGWNDVDVMEEARDLFTRCGKKLQRRRQENEWRLAVSRIPADVDPAEASEELRRKLQDNRQTATTKEAEVFKKFADKQNQLNLEPIEIGDKEADESPADSEEEEEEAKNEREALEDKEKRKDRIKRLLQENKVPADNTENIVDKVQTDDDKNPDSIKEKIDSVMEKSAVDKEKDSSVKENLDKTLKNTKEKTDSELISTKKSKDAEEVANENDDINSLSDSSKVGSDIDELHLLQKLHTSNEIEDSSLDSSDSESPIDISDSLESNSDNEDRMSVISIENSSYSENESTQDNMDIGNKKDSDSEKQNTSDKQEKQLNIIPLKDGNTDNVATEKVVHEEAPTQTMEIEYSSLGNARKNITSDNDVCPSAEEILLASSEEDNNKDSPNNDCMNVDDDALSISETCIDFQDNTKIKERLNNVPNSSANNENPKDNTIEIEIEGLNGDKRLSGENTTLKNTCSESKIAMSV